MCLRSGFVNNTFYVPGIGKKVIGTCTKTAIQLVHKMGQNSAQHGKLWNSVVLTLWYSLTQTYSNMSDKGGNGSKFCER